MRSLAAVVEKIRHLTGRGRVWLRRWAGLVALLRAAGLPLVGALYYSGAWGGVRCTVVALFLGLLSRLSKVVQRGLLLGAFYMLLLFGAGLAGAHLWSRVPLGLARMVGTTGLVAVLTLVVLAQWAWIHVGRSLLLEVALRFEGWRLSQRGVVFGLLLLPWALVPSISDVDAYLRQELSRAGYVDVGPITSVDSPQNAKKRGRLSSRFIVRASLREGIPADIYLLELRHSLRGKPARLAGIFNLSRTAAVSESRLVARGGWAAWQVGEGSVHVVGMHGERVEAGEGWDEVGQVQRALTNLQETGMSHGVSRRDLTWGEAGALSELKLDSGELILSADGKEFRWVLGSFVPDDAETSLRVEVVPPPRPGSMATWAVDRARAMPWMGSNRLQWIKAIVYKLRAEAEDLTEEVTATDPEKAVLEQMGDVRGRLPILGESPIDKWPPDPIAPVLKAPLPGEGQWVDLTHEKAFSRLESSSMLFTFLRVDPKRPHHQVFVVIWDPRRIGLHIVAGTEEPRSTLGNRGKGQIPRDPAQLERVVAAFNGAFQAVHGEFGMVEDAVVQLPPKPFAATVVSDRAGTARLGTWPETPTKISPEIWGLRQNMTPLVAEGQANPYKRHWWGGTPEGWADDTRTVRSALCRTKAGFLVYAYSSSIDPDRLAKALVQTNCDYGIHLDMNGGHAGFELYRVAPKGALPAVPRQLDTVWEATGTISDFPSHVFNARLLARTMPLMNFPRYIRRTPRDFFYLSELPLLPGAVVPQPGAEPLEFGTPDLPENHFPPYLMAASTNEEKVREVWRLDARQLRPVAGGGRVLVGFGAGEGERSLFWTPLGFKIGAEPPAHATLLARETPEGPVWACVDAPGFLTIIGVSGEKEDKLERLLARGVCQERITLDNWPAVGDEAKSAENTLFRAPSALDVKLFPDTPIVPPARWGVPQAKRADLVP